MFGLWKLFDCRVLIDRLQVVVEFYWGFCGSATIFE